MSEIDIIESCDSDGSHHSTESSQLSTQSTKFKTSDHFRAFENKMKCNYCGKVFSGKSGSSTLKRHLNNAHNKFGPKSMKITDMFEKEEESEKLDPNEELISFLVCGDHPFNTVEEPAFNSFISSLNSTYKMPSRFTVKRKVDSKFNYYEAKLKNYLQKIGGKISFSTDLWTSIKKTALHCSHSAFSG